MSADKLIADLMTLPVDTYLEHAGVIVVRVTEHKDVVLRAGTVTTFAGRRDAPDYMATRVAECVLRTRIDPPCARCGVNKREEKSYCRACWSDICVENNRTYQEKRHAA